MGRAEQPPVEFEHLFFLHIPKTAGTSLGDYVAGQFGPDEIFPPYLPFDLSRDLLERAGQYRYFRGHFRYGIMRSIVGARPTALTMVRDPVERFLSRFGFMQSRESWIYRIRFDQLKELSLEAYLDDPSLVSASENIDPQVRMLAEYLDAETLGELKPGGPEPPRWGTWLEWATALIGSFAFVGLTERFEDSLLLLAYTFGWRPAPEVRRLNVTPRRPERDQCSAQTLGHVARYNVLDLALYERARRVFEQRYESMVAALTARADRRAGPRTNEVDPRTLHALVDERYQRWLLERSSPIRRGRLDLAGKAPGLGWYPAERHAIHGTVRWTGPTCEADVDLALPLGRDAEVRFQVMMALAPDVPASLRLDVDGDSVPLSRHPNEDGTLEFRARIPREVVARRGGFVRLRFAVARTIVPAEVDPTNRDRRPLGLAFNWIAILAD